MVTKLRSTTLKKLKPRKRVTRLKPVDFVVAEREVKKTRIIPIPIILGAKTLLTKRKIPPVKIPKIKPGKIKPGKGIIGGPPLPGGRLGPLQGGPVSSSVATSVYYWPRSLLMVINYHGGAQYEYYQTSFDLFNYIYNGLGTATTDGQNQYGRWWKGKSNPSVGASIRTRLQRGMADYKRVR